MLAIPMDHPTLIYQTRCFCQGSHHPPDCSGARSHALRRPQQLRAQISGLLRRDRCHSSLALGNTAKAPELITWANKSDFTCI